MPNPGNLPNLTWSQAISNHMGLDGPQQAYNSQMQGLRTALLNSMGAACQDSFERGQWSESAAEGQMSHLQPPQCLALREKMQEMCEQGDAQGHKLARTDNDHRPSEYHAGRAG